MNLIMLGNGAGGTLDLYNTCFILQNDKGNFLVDTGGSVEVVRRIKKSGLELRDIKNIFISHSHTDHVLGLIWMFKKMGSKILRGEENEKVNIYCNDTVYETIINVAKYTLPENLLKKIYKGVNFIVVNDLDRYDINGVQYEFFDILAKGTKQFGFESIIDDERFIFLGDEPLNGELCDRVRGAFFVTHEAFCLDKEESKFNAYAKNHSTALSAAKTMNELDVKNLLLYHTEETHGIERKNLYTEEAKQVFSGNVYVPDDLEVIKLSLIPRG